MPTPDPLIGKTIAQYEIVAKLGGGGMGVVYKARDTRLGRLVALKFLPPQWSHDENTKQRFIREAQAASVADHQNICTVHSIESTDDGQLFIVMAYYDGQTLKQKLEGGALDVDEALAIAAQVAEGLARAHAQGVVHRDIKPGNLMITEDGVRILDFGLAKFADSLQLTITGSTLGTVAYMSPEQTRGEEADGRSDVWAVGAVLYEMLAGRMPFKGAYPEAVSYAIRNDAPPPFGASGRTIPEPVERLVLHALEKDPTKRFQSARELARDLRILQGRTVPHDLRTELLPTVPRPAQPERRSWHRGRNVTLAAVALCVVTMVGAPLWLFSPVERIPLAVAPVANQTGYPELDAYRLPLTQTLVDELSDRPSIRVLPYERLLEIVRGFLQSETDLSSRQAIQAITSHSAVQFVIVPTIVYENGAWRAKAEIRNAQTATNVAVYQTTPVRSSSLKDAAYGLTGSLADKIQDHFTVTGPHKLRVANAIRSLTGSSLSRVKPRVRTLDAAAAFEQGIRAYAELEYAAALRWFASAAEQDPRNPLPFAWRSRVAQLLRQDDEAVKAADQAERLTTSEIRVVDRLFIAAVAAEARRDINAADARYRELVATHRDEPTWLVELAAFEDRQLRYADAVDSYHQALKLDGHFVRPHLKLCWLYNTARLNEPASAKEQGQLALSGYKALGNRPGEGQALLCLTEVLRVGPAEERRQARLDAEAALKIFQDPGHDYKLARAYFYVGLAAAMQENWGDAVTFWEKSLPATKDVGDMDLEPLLLMNLGAAHQNLGHRLRAVDYDQQSFKLFQVTGQEQRAAQVQINAGGLLITFGGNPDDGLRTVQSALAVTRKLGDKPFEVVGLQNVATYYRNSGRHAEAERELNRAIEIAKERNLNPRIALLNIDLAQSRFELGEYQGAEGLVNTLVAGSGHDSAKARIVLGRIHTRLGDFQAAQTDLSEASDDIEKRDDSDLIGALWEAMGELAFESGKPDEARKRFSRVAALWTDDLPENASVEGRAYVGLIDGLTGKPTHGEMALRSSLEQAHKTARLSIEARSRVFLARVYLAQRRFDQALNALMDIPPDTSERTLGPELRAQVHYWRSKALAGSGDPAGAQYETNIARKLIEDLRTSLAQQYRVFFGSRPDVRLIIK